MKIYKQKLNITERQHIELPLGAKILTVQTQRGEPCLWYLFDENRASEIHEIEIIVMIGTGNTIGDQQLKYISTIQTHNETLVLHVFKVSREPGISIHPQ